MDTDRYEGRRSGGEQPVEICCKMLRNRFKSCLAVNAILQKSSKSGGVVSEVGIFGNLERIREHRSDRMQLVVRDRCYRCVRPIGMLDRQPGMYDGVGRARSVVRRPDCGSYVYAGISPKLAINQLWVYRQRSMVWHEVD